MGFYRYSYRKQEFSHLIQIYKTSFALRCFPEVLRDVNVIFIRKVGRKTALPKAYRPISHKFFLLKGMEKIIDIHIRSKIISLASLHPWTLCLLRSTKQRDCTFMEIEGALDIAFFEPNGMADQGLFFKGV